MPREIVKIRMCAHAPYESAAHFLALLAYPEPGDSVEREKFRGAQCRWAIEARMAYDREWGDAHQWIRPRFFSAPTNVHAAILKRGRNKLLHRIAATCIIWPQLTKVITSKLPLVEGCVPTVENMSILAADLLGWKGDSYSTVKSKIWKPTKPVAHLAAAWVPLLCLDRPEMLEHETHDPIMNLFFDPSYIVALIVAAEHLRLMLPKVKRFRKLREDDLIKVTLEVVV
jgi:hypothetical protein